MFEESNIYEAKLEGSNLRMIQRDLDSCKMKGYERPEFIKVLEPGFLKKLPIPQKFTSQYIQGDRQLISLFSPLSKFWHVKLERDEHFVYFGDGWEDFAKAHDLAEGYMVAFRYEGNMIFVIKVFDLDGCLKEYNKACTYVPEQEAEVQHVQPIQQEPPVQQLLIQPEQLAQQQPPVQHEQPVQQSSVQQQPPVQHEQPVRQTNILHDTSENQNTNKRKLEMSNSLALQLVPQQQAVQDTNKQQLEMGNSSCQQQLVQQLQPVQPPNHLGAGENQNTNKKELEKSSSSCQQQLVQQQSVQKNKQKLDIGSSSSQQQLSQKQQLVQQPDGLDTGEIQNANKKQLEIETSCQQQLVQQPLVQLQPSLQHEQPVQKPTSVQGCTDENNGTNRSNEEMAISSFQQLLVQQHVQNTIKVMPEIGSSSHQQQLVQQLPSVHHEQPVQQPNSLQDAGENQNKNTKEVVEMVSSPCQQQPVQPQQPVQNANKRSLQIGSSSYQQQLAQQPSVELEQPVQQPNDLQDAGESQNTNDSSYQQQPDLNTNKRKLDLGSSSSQQQADQQLNSLQGASENQNTNKRNQVMQISSLQQTPNASQFVRTFTRSEVRQRFIYVPKTFCQMYSMWDMTDLTLEDLNGNKWYVKMQPVEGKCCIRPGSGLFRQYDIKQNDICVFEIQPGRTLRFWKCKK